MLCLEQEGCCGVTLTQEVLQILLAGSGHKLSHSQRCRVSRPALHQAAMPNIFLSFFTFFLLVCFRLLCVILVFTMCIRVLLLYASKITHTYFYFFIWARLYLFLSSLGSSVIGLPFPPLGCLSVIFLLM